MLTLTNLYTLQAQLDDTVLAKHNLVLDEGIIDKRIFAFKVELGELANEIPVFKYWKKEIKPRTKAARAPYVDLEDAEFYNPVLEEYIDGWHFLLSIGNARKYVPFVQRAEELEIDSSYDSLFYSFKELMDNPLSSAGQFIRAVDLYYSLGLALGFTNKSILNAYLAKHKINYDRLENGY